MSYALVDLLSSVLLLACVGLLGYAAVVRGEWWQQVALACAGASGACQWVVARARRKGYYP